MQKDLLSGLTSGMTDGYNRRTIQMLQKERSYMKRRTDSNVSSVVLGSRIASLRSKRGLTQQQFSEDISGLCGKTQSNLLISAWEKGRRKPTEDVIPIIAKYFNVSVEYLCGLEEDTASDVGGEDLVVASAGSNETDFNFKLSPNDLEQFDGRVVFLAFQNYTHVDQFAIVNADKELFILRDGSLPFTSKDIKAIYTTEPDYMYFKSLNGLYPVDMATLQKSKTRRYQIKMKTSDKHIQEKYNGWYTRSEDGNELINEKKGYILPVEGLNVGFYAYAQQKPVRPY